MKKINLGSLVILLLVVLAIIEFGFLKPVAALLFLAILFRLVPILWRGVIILWEFIEFIVFAPYRYVFGNNLNPYPNNPLTHIFDYDIKKLFR